jgi:RimJ/RimL family protein N-acetyltransferase
VKAVVGSPIELRGARVRLRPFRADELDEVLRGRGGFDDVSEKGSKDLRRRMRERLNRSGSFRGGRLDLAIECDGRLVGEIDARTPSFTPRGVFELGIGLYRDADRGRGLGAEAITLLTDYLFEREGAIRVQGGTRIDNAPMRRVFERLGFTQEGVLRDFLPSGEGRADCVLYAVTRRDRDRGDR